MPLHMKSHAREMTTKLLDMLEDGSLDARYLAGCCLNYMSEVDVVDMAYTNGIVDDDDFVDDEADEDEV